MAVIANSRQGGKGRKTYARADFHPMSQPDRAKDEALPMPITVLKMFLLPKP